VRSYATAGNPVAPASDGGGGGGSGSYFNKWLLNQRKGRELTSNLVCSAIILWKPIPTPSMTASKHAHPIAEFRAAFAPPRIAKAPPVKKPAMTIYLLVSSPSVFSSCFNTY
jgi:hypothetical protein